jgi:hypothetical protein
MPSGRLGALIGLTAGRLGSASQLRPGKAKHATSRSMWLKRARSMPIMVVDPVPLIMRGGRAPSMRSCWFSQQVLAAVPFQIALVPTHRPLLRHQDQLHQSSHAAKADVRCRMISNHRLITSGSVVARVQSPAPLFVEISGTSNQAPRQRAELSAMPTQVLRQGGPPLCLFGNA